MTRLQLHLISLKGNARHQKVNKSKKQLLKEIKSTEDSLRPLLKKYHDFIESDGLARIAESASSYSNVSKQLDGLYKMKNALELMKDLLKTVHDFSSMYMEAQSKGAFLSEALGSDMDEFLQDVPRSGLGNS